MKQFIAPIKIAFLLAIAIVVGQPQAKALVLPDPFATFDGLPVARQFDEFISYSARLIDDEFGLIDLGAAGVGNFAITMLTQANGNFNQGIDTTAGPVDFEKQVISSAGGGANAAPDFSGTWGAGVQTDGPVLVDEVLAFLHEIDGPTANIPVFSFDLVEPASEAKRDLRMVAEMRIFDPGTNTVLASWSLDAVNNGTFDPTSFITVEGLIELTSPISNTVYTANNTTGSGKFDFLVVAPTLDLNDWKGQGYEFHAYASFTDLHGGGEEATIIGGLPSRQQDVPVTPEPGTFMLLSVAGIVFLARKKLASLSAS